MRSALRVLVALAVLLTADLGFALTQREIDKGAERAQSGVRGTTRRLAGNAFEGRDNATPGSFRAQTWLIKKLRRLGSGLAPGTGDAAYTQPFVQSGQSGTNLLAVIPGRDLPGEYVVVGAHYDHLDTRSTPSGACAANGTPGGEVCHGATDNAAGVAAVLAIGRAIRKLPTPPRRSVVLALWDSEEDGLLGSLYYITHPLAPLGQTRGYVNFDILGQNLVPSLRETSFAIGAETGGPALQSFVENAVATEGLQTELLSYIFGQLRSDYVHFVNAGVPTVFFSDATGPCYHTIGDTPKILNTRKLKAQSRIGYRITVALAEGATTPAFQPPNPGLAVYADAVALQGVVARARDDLPMFAPTQQAILQGVDASLTQIVADGPALFDSFDVNTVLGSALQTLGAIETLPCGKM